jgi:hypothetical protein
MLVQLIILGVVATAEVVQAIAGSVQAWRKRQREDELPCTIIRFEAGTLDEIGRLHTFWRAEREETGKD